MIIDWPTSINSNILNSTSITISESGIEKDESADNFVDSRNITSYLSCESYSVQMDFNWNLKNDAGMSEYDKFINWYEVKHRKGVNEFRFPSIRRHNADGTKPICHYIISSAISSQKHGDNMRVSMTWKEVFSGPLNVPLELSSAEFPETLINRKILDSTTWTIGNAGVNVDLGENGNFESRSLASYSTPEKYSVTMDFSWDSLDLNGNSEFDRFLLWYQFGHKKGTRTFSFPSIRKFTSLGPIIEETENKKFRIVGDISAVESGYCMRVSMTWELIESVYSEITEDTLEISNVFLRTNGCYTHDLVVVFNRDLNDNEIYLKKYEYTIYAGTNTVDAMIPINQMTDCFEATPIVKNENSFYGIRLKVLKDGFYYFGIGKNSYSSSAPNCTRTYLKKDTREESDILYGTGV